MNKLFLNIILATAVAFCLGSCGYDNFDEPESMLAGNIQYNGQNLQLQGSAGSFRLISRDMSSNRLSPSMLIRTAALVPAFSTVIIRL